MIELRAQPGIPRRVTCLASGREAQLLMVRHRVLILNFVAGVAVRRQSLELPGCQAFVTRIALNRRVRPDQWKAVLVLLDRVEGNTPAFHRVALIAGGPELPPVNIGVAVCASRPDIAEHQAGVALHAAEVRVTASQREVRFVVVKLWDTP